MTAWTHPAAGETAPFAAVEGVADRCEFPAERSRPLRAAILVASVAAGAAGATLATRSVPAADLVLPLVLGLAFAGGLLSTWSPCGYSSLSLLRPVGRPRTRALARYTPTFLLHGLGYAVGAVILGGALGLLGTALGLSVAVLAVPAGLGLAGLVYGAHQLGFLRVPYPQRRAQVPHDARQRFPMWVVGGLYGLSLGLNYLTYVQTPILYLVTAVALFGGDVAAAILLFAAFNAGRFLPMAVNYLPVSDIAVQDWLARRQEDAALLDGALLAAAGAALLTLAIP